MGKKKQLNKKSTTKKAKNAVKNTGNSEVTLNQSPRGLELFLLLPVLFFVSLYLFWVRLRSVPSGVYGLSWYAGGEIDNDLYARFRMTTFLLVVIVFTLLLLGFILMGYVKFIRHKVYIPMLVFAAAAMLSYAFSDYKEIAGTGYMERYESTAVLICYMILLLYVMHAVNSEGQVKLAVHCFTAACILLGIWGVMQTRGFHLGSLPEWLYIPLDMMDSVDAGKAVADNANIWFFSNRNYLSFFIIFPISIFAMSCIRQQNNVKKCGYAALTGLMLYCLWHAKSLSGIVALTVSICVAIVIAGPSNLMKWRKSLGLLLIAAVISIGTSLPAITGQLQGLTLFSRMPGVAEVYAEEVAPAYTSTAPLAFVEIDSIVTDGANVTFDFDGTEVIITVENNQLKSVTDKAGNPLAPDSGLLNVSTYIDETAKAPLLQVQTASYTWMFGIVDGELLFVSPSGKGVKLDKTEHFGFEGHERFGSGRGYIWSRTLPLLKGAVLVGYGADTYAPVFPQDDYAGKYSHMHNTTIIVDKAHNMYLGSAVNTGVISMLALIAIYGIYLIESFKIYRRRSFEGYMDYIGMGIFVAAAGFVIAGLVNDSTVQVMPVAYTFLGMGFAINRMLQNNHQKKNKEV